MSITRRKFLKAGTLVALTAAFPLKSVLGQSLKDGDGNPMDQNPGQADPLSFYSRSAFSSYLNSIFQLYTGYSTVDVALVEVKDMLPASEKPANGRECFSLLFRGGSVALPQNTYRIDHPSLGRFQMFLVPGGPDDNGAQSYVATINRIPYSPLNAPVRKSLDGARPAAQAAPPAKTNTAPKTDQPATRKPPQKRKPSGKSGDQEDFQGV